MKNLFLRKIALTCFLVVGSFIILMLLPKQAQGATSPCYTMGDVSKDNQVTQIDVDWINQNIAGTRSFDAIQRIRGDVDDDTFQGTIDSNDANWVSQRAAGLPVIFPVCDPKDSKPLAQCRPTGNASALWGSGKVNKFDRLKILEEEAGLNPPWTGTERDDADVHYHGYEYAFGTEQHPAGPPPYVVDPLSSDGFEGNLSSLDANIIENYVVGSLTDFSAANFGKTCHTALVDSTPVRGAMINSSQTGASFPTSHTFNVSSNNVNTVLTAQPLAGYTFVNWTGDCSSVSGNQCTLTLAGDILEVRDKIVVANYTPAAAGPDYVPRNLAGPGGTYCTGQNYTFTFQTANIGGSPGGATSNTQAATGLGSPGSQNYSVGSLAAGASVSHSFTTSWPSAGQRVVQVTVDTGGAIAESNEGNNTISTPAGSINVTDCSVPQPDYIIRNISGGMSPVVSGPTTVCINNDANYDFQTANVGNGGSSNVSNTRVTASGGASRPQQDDAVRGLAAGGDFVTHRFTTFWNSTGTKTITFTADSNNNVPNESNEGNNTVTLTVTVNNTCVLLPNLVVSNITSDASSKTCGDTVNFDITITNIGSAPVTNPPTWVIETLIRINGSFLGAPPYPDPAPLSSLAAGASYTHNIGWPSASAGGSTLTAIADSSGDVPESNENDNTRNYNFNISCASPDYVIRNSTGGTVPAITASTTTVCTGDPVDFSARTVNIGSIAGGGTSRTRVTFGSGASLASYDFFPVADLGAGSFESHNANFGVYWTTTGSKTVRFTADVSNNIVETNEGNNSASITVTVNSCLPPATVDIDALDPATGNYSDGPVTIPYGTATTLRWTSANATSCSASGGWSGSKSLSGTQSTGNLTTSRTFTLTCTGAGGNGSDSVTVNVAAPDFSITVTPASLNTQQDNSASPAIFTVNVCTNSPGYDGPIEVDVYDLTTTTGSTAGVTWTLLNPANGDDEDGPPLQREIDVDAISCSGGGTDLRLTVRTTTSTRYGDYTFYLRGMDDGRNIGDSSPFCGAGDPHCDTGVMRVVDQPWFQTLGGDIGSLSDITVTKTAPYVEFLGISRGSINASFRSAKNWIIQNYGGNLLGNEINPGVNGSIYTAMFTKFSGKCSIQTITSTTTSRATLESLASNPTCNILRRGSGVGNGDYEINSSNGWDSPYSGGPAIIFVGDDLDIRNNVSVSPGTGLIWVVGDNIDVRNNLTSIEGFYMVDDDFNTNSGSVNCDNNVRSNYTFNDSQLKINGAVYAFGRICMARSLLPGNNTVAPPIGPVGATNNPAELITYRPEYLYLFRNLVGQSKPSFLEVAP